MVRYAAEFCVQNIKGRMQPNSKTQRNRCSPGGAPRAALPPRGKINLRGPESHLDLLVHPEWKSRRKGLNFHRWQRRGSLHMHFSRKGRRQWQNVKTAFLELSLRMCLFISETWGRNGHLSVPMCTSMRSGSWKWNHIQTQVCRLMMLHLKQPTVVSNTCPMM